MAKLTVLSFGAGQDSTALLYHTVYSAEFRVQAGIESFIVVMSDTGNEHPETYEHIKEVETFCIQNMIPFYFLPSNSAYRPESWREGLIGFYERTKTVGSKAFKKTCTDNLKIKPIYNFLNNYVIDWYNLEEEIVSRFGPKTRDKYEELQANGDLTTMRISFLAKKDGLVLFSEKYGKIDMMIGIAAGEETRVAEDTEETPLWARKSVRKIYPLVDLGWDRAKCQEVITAYGKKVPPPSNCILCPFMSLQELLFLYRFHREWFDKWVILESHKLEKYAHLGNKNVGVWGNTKTIPEMLEVAIVKYGHMSDPELREYKMSHGHCVKSKY